MKRILPILLISFFLVKTSRAQFVTIPDASLRGNLISLFPSAFNVMGQMDTTYSGIVNTTSLTLLSGTIADWDGIQYFDGLKFIVANSAAVMPVVLPRNPNMSLTIRTYTGSQISPVWYGISELIILSGINVTSIGSLPTTTMTQFYLQNMPLLTAIPALPSNVGKIQLENTGVSSFANFPSLCSDLILRNCNVASLPNLSSNLARLTIAYCLFNSLPAFPSTLTNVSISYTPLINLPSLPNALVQLVVSHGELTSLPVLNPGLKLINVEYNQLTVFPVMPSSLINITANNNNISTISGPFPNLATSINFRHNQLQSVPLPLPTIGPTLDLGENNFTSFPAITVTTGNFPSVLLLDHNQLTSMGDITSTNSFTLDVSYNQLNFLPLAKFYRIYASNNDLLAVYPQFFALLMDLRQNPNLTCLPFIAKDGMELYADLPINCYPNKVNSGIFYQYDNGSLVHTYRTPITSGYDTIPVCSLFSNTNNCGSIPKIGGYVFVDQNSNGIKDAGEYGQPNVRINSSNGSFTFTDNNGYYETLFSQSGSYNVSYAGTLPGYFNLYPGTTQYASIDGYGVEVERNFAYQPNASVDSLKMSVTSMQLPRAGRKLTYNLTCFNSGTTNLDVPLQFSFDNSKMTYQSSSASGATVAGNVLSIPNTNYVSGQSRSFTVDFMVSTSATIGTPLYTGLSALVNGHLFRGGDTVKVFGPFDPNNKKAADTISPLRLAAGDGVEYTIRFQNTGNDTAFKVIITDTLYTHMMESSVLLTGSSHPCKLTVKGRYLSFEFNNINLPDSFVNEPRSHGYVKFKVRPLSTVPVNGQVANRANIYFDYAAPVVTNTMLTRIYYLNPTGNMTNGAISVCQNAAPPVVTFTGTSGTAPYTFTYTINGGAPLTITTGSGANPQSVSITVPTSTTGMFNYSLTKVADVYLNSNVTGSTYAVTVNATPAVSFTGLASTYCSGDASVFLVGSPGGGVFSGPGISGNVFDPASAGVGGPYSISYNYTNASGCSGTVSQQVTVNDCPTYTTLNLKLFIQGYYYGAGTMQPVLVNQSAGAGSNEVDDILIEIHDGAAPGNVLASVTGRLHTDGTVSVEIPATVLGSHYIAVKHRNTVQTWSATPVNFAGGITGYDFSTAASMAFGNNQIEMEPGVFAFYTGDINQDENIDISDYPELDQDVSNFEFGYFTTDLNGDGNVDISDYPVIDANISNFIYSNHP